MTDATPLWQPDWDLPPGVHAFVSTRLGGYSTGPWKQFNLGQHVGDAAAAVSANRDLLRTQIGGLAGLAGPPHVQWVRQVHGTSVLEATVPVREPAPEADAIYTRSAGLAIGVLTADCLPVLLCSQDGSEVAVAHAGWRGLCNGVLEATIRSFDTPSEHLRAWLGPAIGPCHFEVGDEVRQAFLELSGASGVETAAAFATGARSGKWFADLYALARVRLRSAGLRDIAGEPLCTSCNSERFYSYRKEPVTGRFATLILRVS